MNDLIAQLTQRVGLTPDQARQAAETMLGFMKSRLPAPIASQLEAALVDTGGAGGADGGIGGIAKGLGGMLGR